jgi:hypothetical protein
VTAACCLQSPFFHKDLMKFLHQEFSNKSYSGYFALQPELQRDSAGNR